MPILEAERIPSKWEDRDELIRHSAVTDSMLHCSSAARRHQYDLQERTNSKHVDSHDALMTGYNK